MPAPQFTPDIHAIQPGRPRRHFCITHAVKVCGSWHYPNSAQNPATDIRRHFFAKSG
jgi:hypothetical protein